MPRTKGHGTRKRGARGRGLGNSKKIEKRADWYLEKYGQGVGRDAHERAEKAGKSYS
jgi:hypothetical protein